MSKLEERPWGSYEVLLDTNITKVKQIIVKPGQRLSYQYHDKRAESWTLVQGLGLITIDDTAIEIGAGNSFFIPEKAKHRIANIGEEDLIFIEVQLGEYFGEDDIVRIEDDYNRE